MSDHFDGKRFLNPKRGCSHSWRDLIRWRFTSRPKPWPTYVPLPLDKPPPKVEASALRVSFVGHSTVLIQTQGVNIVTDPVWAEKLLPFSWKRMKRVTDPGIAFDALPKVDVLLISHNHYDHLNKESIEKICARDHPTVFAPLGNEKILHAFNSSIQVKTLDWEECQRASENITICLEPTQHWSRRTFWDTDKALWGAFVIKTKGGNIYFASDSGYGQGELFRKAKQKYGHFRLALLPIGVYEPRWFMQHNHLNPEEAVLAFKDLGAENAMAIHFATFRLGDEAYGEPEMLLEIAKKEHGIAQEQFRALKPGEFWNVPSSFYQ